jgi:hypothetical protein
VLAALAGRLGGGERRNAVANDDNVRGDGLHAWASRRCVGGVRPNAKSAQISALFVDRGGAARGGAAGGVRSRE